MSAIDCTLKSYLVRESLTSTKQKPARMPLSRDCRGLKRDSNGEETKGSTPDSDRIGESCRETQRDADAMDRLEEATLELELKRDRGAALKPTTQGCLCQREKSSQAWASAVWSNQKKPTSVLRKA